MEIAVCVHLYHPDMWDKIESYFVGGTIFWVRNDIMKKYLTNDKIDWILKLLLPNYSYEPSYAHAMERMFAYFVYNQQKEMVVIN